MHKTTFGLHEILNCTYLKFTVYCRKQTYIHTTSANAVTLVWGLLRLAPIIHCFSSPSRFLWRHPLPKHPTSLFTSTELVHKLYLKSRGKLRMRCLLYTTFLVVYWVSGQYGLDMFDAQRAEQDDGIFECNRRPRRVREMPSTLKFTRFTQMQCRLLWRVQVTNE